MTSKRSAAKPDTGQGPRTPAPSLLAYALVALYLIPIFPHGGSANEETRWATAASLVERGSFEISWTGSLLGPIVDTAKVGERIYSNKAPGGVVVALPGYLLARPFTGPPDAGNIRLTWTMMRWFLSTIPLLWWAAILAKRGASPLALTAIVFGTPLFLYGLLLFSHVLAAVAVYGAYRLLFRNAVGPSPLEALLAGALAGAAVSAEFTAAIAVIVLVLGALLASARSPRARATTLGWIVLGGLPFAAGLALYNQALFGSPFALSYAHESFQEWAQVAQRGVFGISWPDPRNLWLLLVSPSRGLLFQSPILILSGIALFRIRGEDSLRRKVRLAAVLAGIVLLSGHGAAHGGWAAGPRYLVFIVPLLVEPLVEEGGRLLRGTASGALVGISIVLSTLPALSFPFVPPEFSFPHNTLWGRLMLEEGWATPTLGALAGLGAGLAALAPIGLALAVVVVLSLRGAGSKLAGGVVAGVIIACAYSTVPGFDDTTMALRRASIAERFFRPENRLEKFRSMRLDPAASRMLEDLPWMIADVQTLAPSNWPYRNAPLATDGPTGLNRRVVALDKEGRAAEAERLLRAARDEFPFARCEFTEELAVVLYRANRKDEALAELEAVRPLVRAPARAECGMVLFRLASLYQERGRRSEALAAYSGFLASTEGTADPQTAGAREIARKAAAALGAAAPAPR